MPPPFLGEEAVVPLFSKHVQGGPHTELLPCPHRLGRSALSATFSTRRNLESCNTKIAADGGLTWPTTQVLLDNVEQGCDVISSDHSESTVQWVSDLNLNKLQRSEQPPLKLRGFYIFTTPESVQLGGHSVLLLSLGLLQVAHFHCSGILAEEPVLRLI